MIYRWQCYVLFFSVYIVIMSIARISQPRMHLVIVNRRQCTQKMRVIDAKISVQNHNRIILSISRTLLKLPSLMPTGIGVTRRGGGERGSRLRQHKVKRSVLQIDPNVISSMGATDMNAALL
jgi:hypothetical protein